jgi:hypothetical protein
VLTNQVEIATTPSFTYTDDNPSNDQDALAYTVRESGPNLMILKHSDWQGGDPWQLHYSYEMHNLGTTAVQGFVMTDTYPLSTSLNYQNVWWNPPDFFTDTTSALVWTFGGTLNPGDTVNGEIMLDVDADIGFGRVLTNVIAVEPQPNETYTADNTAFAVETTGPDLYVDKTALAGEVGMGELVTFTLRFGNRAERWVDEVNGDIWLTDTLPAQMTYYTSTFRYCDTPPCYAFPNIVGNKLGFNMGPRTGTGWWDEIYLTVRVTGTVTPGTVFTNRLDIVSDNPADVEPYITNNTDTATVDFAALKIYLPVTMRND